MRHTAPRDGAPTTSGAIGFSFPKSRAIRSPVARPDLPIRDCTEADLPGLLAVYNDVIATSTAVFFDKPVTLDDRRDWWRARVAQGYPVIVALDSQGVAGFGTFGDFRSFPGYRFTVEHSVHVRTDRRGSGLGQALVLELIERARA